MISKIYFAILLSFFTTDNLNAMKQKKVRKTSLVTQKPTPINPKKKVHICKLCYSNRIKSAAKYLTYHNMTIDTTTLAMLNRITCNTLMEQRPLKTASGISMFCDEKNMCHALKNEYFSLFIQQ